MGDVTAVILAVEVNFFNAFIRFRHCVFNIRRSSDDAENAPPVGDELIRYVFRPSVENEASRCLRRVYPGDLLPLFSS